MRAIDVSWTLSVESGLLAPIQAALVTLHADWMGLALPRRRP